MELTRKPVWAGMFYPQEPAGLRALIEGYLEKTQTIQIPGQIKAIIVPHAGYEYSGQTAAWGYRQLKVQSSNFKFQSTHYVVMGPSHRYRFDNLVADPHTQWETPLGKVKHMVPEPSPMVGISSEPHREEHCLEVQVPFLQMTNDKFQITNLLTGTEVEVERVADYLRLHYPKSVFIISTDLSHYLPMNAAGKKDMQTVMAIEKLDTGYFEREENVACGTAGVRVALTMAKKKGWRTQVIHYETSASAFGETGRVVGYLAAVLYEIPK